jgi:hypothetical protein
MRSAGQLVVGQEAYTARGSISYSDFAKQNQLDGMEQVLLEDNVTIVWPTGAVFLKTTGQMYGVPLEPYVLADWKLKHATAWLQKTGADFQECKRQATMDPESWDWVSDLKRLREIGLHAQRNFHECREAFEVACGRGAEWERQRKEQEARIQRGRQLQDQIRFKALAAIQEIELNDTTQTEDDDE